MSDGGGPDLTGGNLFNDGGAVVLDHVRVTGGEGAIGGGLGNRDGAMTVRQSLIDGNAASQGAGIANVAPSLTPGGSSAAGAVSVSDMTIASSVAGYRGGGVYTNGPGSTTALERVTVTRNTGGDGMPGVVNDPDFAGLVSVEGSIISGNLGFSPRQQLRGPGGQRRRQRLRRHGLLADGRRRPAARRSAAPGGAGWRRVRARRGQPSNRPLRLSAGPDADPDPDACVQQHRGRQARQRPSPRQAASELEVRGAR